MSRGYPPPMKRGVSDLNLYGSQENCISIIEDQSTTSNKHDRTRRLYHKQMSSEDGDSTYSGQTARSGRRNGFRQGEDTIDRMSNMSIASTSSTASTSSSRSKKLLSRMKGRRDNANKIRSNRNLGAISQLGRKMSKVQEGEDDEEGPQTISPIKPNDQDQNQSQHHPHQYPYGYPPPPHPGMQPYPGMHPGMYPPPAMHHPGYYMPPPPQPQPVQPQIIIQQPAGGWGGGPQQESPRGMNQQQYRDQQLINQQQQDIIRQQQQLQEQQQEQLRKQHEAMMKQHQDLASNPPVRKSFSRRYSDESKPPPPPARLKRNSEIDEVSDLSFGSPPLSEDFMEKMQGRMNDRDYYGDKQARDDVKGKSLSRRRSDTAGSESTTASKPNRITDDFTVGILGIGDVTVLEKTIGLLKKNSFSDKFNPGEEKKEPAKPRSGMHGSFVGKTKEDLAKKPSHQTSQVLAKANARMENRESLELDFNDVYSGAKAPSFTVKSGLLSDNAPPKTFKRQDSGGRNFAFENPNFSH